LFNTRNTPLVTAPLIHLRQHSHHTFLHS